MSRALKAVTLAFVLIGGASVGAPRSIVRGAEPTTVTFQHGQYPFVVPADVTSIHVVLVGGRGGAGQGSAVGGYGARVEGDLAVTPGSTLMVNAGNNGESPIEAVHTGGFNGGGAAGSCSCFLFVYMGSGGGASDIRTISRFAPGTLQSRLIVAGGGGGGGHTAAGGNAGSPGASAQGGGVGTSTAGGAGGTGTMPGESGSLGQGGAGAHTVEEPAGGGGGGGYYGGGGGGGGQTTNGGGGGGGSSYLGTATNGSITIDSTGNPRVEITYTPDVGDPPAGAEIVFISSRDGDRDVWTMSSNGSNAEQLTNAPGDDFFPKWSPNGQRVAFASDRDGNPEIYVMNADGTGQTRITNDPAWDDFPTWSPDGQRLAFVSDRDGDFEVYTMDPDGSNVDQLTINTVYDDFPDWSPDGTRIAFMTTPTGQQADLAVMDADGSNVDLLTSTSSASEFYPAWSPNGHQIAFASDEGGNPDVYVMDADGANQTRLTTDAEIDGDPVWAPDGSAIAFATTRAGDIDIYVMSPTGAGQTPLTATNAVDTQPDWKQGAGDSAGNVSATVIVPSSAACLELSTTAVSFGTQPLGAQDQPASPQVTVTNCSGVSETLFARGTDASGTAAAWALVDTTLTCADTLGIDRYRLDLASAALPAPIHLSTSNKQVTSLASGASATQGLSIFMACPGSTGAGQTMSMALNYLVTE